MDLHERARHLATDTPWPYAVWRKTLEAIEGHPAEADLLKVAERTGSPPMVIAARDVYDGIPKWPGPWPDRLEVATPDPTIILVMGDDLVEGDVFAATGLVVRVDGGHHGEHRSAMFAVRSRNWIGHRI